MNELEAERQVRKAEMEKAEADLDTLADDLQKAKDAEQAAIKSGSEEAIRTAKEAEQKARARMGEKLCKLYGPLSTLRAAFQAWAEDYKLDKVTAAGNKYQEMRRKMGDTLSAKMNQVV